MALRGGRRRGAGAGLAAALAAVTLLGAAPLAAQGGRSAYREGLEAYEAGDLPAAVRLLREAIAERPEEGISRFRSRRYTPYFYLGMALADAGDCRAALAAFAESERQGFIQGFPEDHARLVERRRGCREEQARAALDEKARRAAQAVERAVAAAAEVGRLKATPELAGVWEWREDSLEKRWQAAEELLAAAQAGLASARGTVDEAARLPRAADQASQAYWQLEAVRVEASQHLAEVRALVGRQREALNRLAAAGRAALLASAGLAPYPPGIAERRQEVESLLAAAAGGTRSQSPGDLARLEGDLERAIAALEEEAAPPPPPLEAAAAAYFRGDYDRCVELLSASRPGGRRAQAHAALLRAAARFGAFRAGGDADPSLLSQARADVEECRRLDPTLRPAAAFFSPAFLAFFSASPAASR